MRSSLCWRRLLLAPGRSAGDVVQDEFTWLRQQVCATAAVCIQSVLS